MAEDRASRTHGEGLQIGEDVAEDRQISVEDPEMRHDRKSKSKSKSIDGSKRHVARDTDCGAVAACTATPANRPEHEALPPLKADIEAQALRIVEAHVDRACIPSPAVQELEAAGGTVICRPWRSRNGGWFAKDVLGLDPRDYTIARPAGTTVPIALGRPAKSPAAICGRCRLREACTSAGKGTGRTVTIADDEILQQRMRKLAKTKAGRERFRERVAVEHSLAHIGYRQRPRARYVGTPENTFDLGCAGILQNLEITRRKAPQTQAIQTGRCFWALTTTITQSNDRHDTNRDY